MSTRCELKEVEAGNVDDFNTREVAERTDDTVVLRVDNQRTTALAVTAVTHLALTRAELAAVRSLLNIGIC